MRELLEWVMQREEAAEVSRRHSRTAFHVLCFYTCLDSWVRIFLGLRLQQETQWEIVASCPQRGNGNKIPVISTSH